jgi:predicted CXXCH cytochrome family protein
MHPLLQRLIFVAVTGITAAHAATPDYSDSTRCAACHPQQHQRWQGSHHDLAMAEANEDTVLGDFDNAKFEADGVGSLFFHRDGQYLVRTEGPDGKPADYPIRYTFGWTPLQQYLIEFPGGRLQALGTAWDSRPADQGGQRWFDLYPDQQLSPGNPLHWTGRDQTWNYQCAECHSTNLQKGYAPASDSYDTTWSEINVGCEACHGPGSAHITWAESGDANKGDDNGLQVHLGTGLDTAWPTDPATGKPRRAKPRTQHTEIEVCARCHSRRGQIWPDYQYGDSLDQSHRLALLDPQLYFPDGQIKDEVYVYGSFIQSAMYRAGVTCSDCHDSHATGLRADGNALCSRCHQPQRYDGSSHHHHPKDSPGSACIACHMPQRTYMGVDRRADHSLRVPRPDLSLRLDTPNACEQCHAEQGNQWAADAVEQWFPDSRQRGLHFGETLHAAAIGAGDAGDRLQALAADSDQPGIARATAIGQLRQYADANALFTVQRLLKDPDPLVRREAERFLSLADIRTRVDQGWTALADPSRGVRLEATRLLAPLMRQRLPERWRKQLEQGIDEYFQAQMTNAERPESRLNLGLILASIGEAGAAAENYRKAIDLDPTFFPAYVNLADLYRQQQRDADGQAILRQGIAVLIDNPSEKASLHHALGLSLVRSGNKPAAIRELARGAELAPQLPRYSYIYAIALNSSDQAGQALEVLQQAVSRHPHNRDLLTTLVTLNREQNKGDDARHYLKQLREAYPDDPQVRELERQLDSPVEN